MGARSLRIKHFTAPDMAQAMRLVRQELGPEAVILSTGKVSGGVEIAAAVETDPIRSAEPTPTPRATVAPDDASAITAGGGALEELARQVEGLRRQLSRHVLASDLGAENAARPELAAAYRHLRGQELDPLIIEALLEGLGAPQGAGLLPMLAIRLKKMLRVAPEPRFGGGQAKVWALVGPTGVGKTTTVAKLAASFAMKAGLRVGLVTLDTFRIAAAEQLKVYGRIMDLPTVVVGGAKEYQRAVEELSGLDLILVDTVGRAPGDADNLAELRSILSAHPRTERHLVLACPTRDADQKRIIEGFAMFEPKSLVFTKLDETTVYGPILNQVARAKLPVSYLTTGQRVPDDMEQATLDGLARRLLPPRREQTWPAGC